MKKNTAIAAIVAALLATSGLYAQGFNNTSQLQQYGFSKTAQAATYGTQSDGYGVQQNEGYFISADAAENGSLPPISSSNSSLPSITNQKSSKAPVVSSKSKGGNEVYSQDSVSLPPVTTLPVPSRTALPPLYSDTMMTVPIEERE